MVKVWFDCVSFQKGTVEYIDATEYETGPDGVLNVLNDDGDVIATYPNQAWARVEIEA